MESPGYLAEALPYLLGFHPRTSVAAVLTHKGNLVGTGRLDLPPTPAEWFDFAADAARALTGQFGRPGRPAPDMVALCLLDEPAPGESGRAVATRLTPLAGLLRAAFAHHHVAAPMALCISANRWWDMTQDDTPGPGTPLPENTPGPATLAFTAAGHLPAPHEDTLTATFSPLTGHDADTLRQALNTFTPAEHHAALWPTSAYTLLNRAATAFTDPATTLSPADTAALLHVLDDGLVRDWAMSLPDTHTNPAARRLFTHLATAAITPYEALACAPLTLLAISAWYDDEQALARLALRRACDLNPSAALPALLRDAFNLAITKQDLKDLARAGRPTP
ncbi:DUF4192 domain-containing protein [Streptomyces sp. 372A]